MRNLLLFMILVGSSAIAAPVPAPARKPPPKPAGPEYKPITFMGRVEYIDQEGFILKPEGNPRITWTWRNPDGTTEDFFYKQDNTQPAKFFKFSDRLLTIGGIQLPLNRRWQGRISRGEHNISEVLIGDRVYVTFWTNNGETFCSDLRIVRRPGGRVPDAYGDEDPRYKVKVAAQRNAEQFLEETFAGKWAPRLGAALRR